MSQFPAITPSFRKLKAGEFSVTRFNTISRTPINRIYGTLPYDYELEVRFGGQAGLTDKEASDIYKAWRNSKGNTLQVTIPSKVWDGADSTIFGTVPGTITWFFDEEPPSFESSYSGYTRVSLKFRGRSL